jgi:exoribonuclease R
MPKQIVRIDEDSTELVERFKAIRSELEVPEGFPTEVTAEAERVREAPLVTVDRDETAIPFCTIDPPGSMDLDQALHIERDGRTYRVRYAIAHLPSFVAPGGAIDVETRKRGQTVYSPDERTPLHPPEISEGAASLRPDQERNAYVWDMRVDATGEGTHAEVYEARVRSVDRFDYEQVQHAIDSGTDDERLTLLKEVGLLRIAREAERGGANLPMPDQEVDQQDDGSYVIRFRPPLPAEDWNAQISLMTGMAAAELMIRARVGILRTMPPADQRAIDRFRRQAKALGVVWSQKQSYGEFLRSLDRDDPKHLALIYEATSLFRGAGYTPFDGTVPEQPEHAAVASTYAHVTAPLRRLVDRFGLAVCAAISAGEEIPGWAREALPGIPEVMRTSDHLANAVNRACVDATEAAVLRGRVGQDFEAVVVERNDKGAEVQLLEPAVVANAQGPGDIGDEVKARLTTADVATSTVRFQLQP